MHTSKLVALSNPAFMPGHQLSSGQGKQGAPESLQGGMGNSRQAPHKQPIDLIYFDQKHIDCPDVSICSGVVEQGYSTGRQRTH